MKAQTAKRRLVPRGERERQMLDVASRLFIERGFGGVSMDEIAEAVGVTKPMLYAYFDSKEGLYVACIEREGRPLMAALEAAVDPSLEPERQLWDGLLAFFGYVDEHRDLWRAFYAEASAHGGAAAARVGRLREQMTAALTGMLARTATGAGVGGALATEIELQAHALMGAAEALAAWAIAHPGEASRELLALRLMNFAWMGFGDLLEGRLWLPPSDPPAGSTP
jgi:AcrR family transcriptional regulator